VSSAAKGVKEADRKKIAAVFAKLAKHMGYDRVCRYEAHVAYGLSRHANFALYKLDYKKTRRIGGATSGPSCWATPRT